ncbi:unnamed protein product [Calypogeia fissa]
MAERVLQTLSDHGFHLELPSTGSIGILLGYLGGLAALGAIIPGPKISGAVLADNTRKTYKVNGFNVLLVLLGVLGAASKAGLFRASAIADKGGQLFTTTMAFCVLVASILYAVGSLSNSKSSSLKPHLSGNILNDWWLGVQLNPHFFGLDLKFFWIRAGMIGWQLIGLSIMAKQYEDQGYISLSMALFQGFSFIYIMDYFWYEEYMTSTWDIIAENFGFMLVMGDLVWIPFTFTIQAWWLLRNQVELTRVAATADVVIFVTGYCVFRGANKQKHIFKKDPKALIWGEAPKVIGGKLLVSGYWGIARHCNYLGDLLVAFSFSLPCGFSSPVPYFYPVYLLILLLWRERRDEAKCRDKYKEVWEEYCNAVPWRIFPKLY